MELKKSETPNKLMTILFMPLNGHGHINACLGVAQVLLKRGHRVVFALDNAWRGKLAKEGFEEQLHGVSQNNDGTEFWTQFMAKMAPILRLSPIEKISEFEKPSFKIMFEDHVNREEQYKDIINRIKPDIIVIDNYICSPAQTNSGIPWVWLVSASPSMVIIDERTPPSSSGLSMTESREKWKHFRESKYNIMTPLWEQINEWVKDKGAPSLPKGKLHPYSPYLNIYMLPEELEYLHLRPLPPKWYRFETFLRSSNDVFEIPDFIKNKTGKLIYLSMGTLACSDVSLMMRLINILKESSHRFIVSKGPLSNEYELTDNMWGAASVPQTKVLPLVDLVITHGGNNTVNESFYYGKPMIVMPLFGDQYDNAQRIDDTGYGIRLDPYNCTKEQLLNSIEKLLNDNELKVKLIAASKRMQSSQSLEKAADLIENIIQN